MGGLETLLHEGIEDFETLSRGSRENLETETSATMSLMTERPDSLLPFEFSSTVSECKAVKDSGILPDFSKCFEITSSYTKSPAETK